MERAEHRTPVSAGKDSDGGPRKDSDRTGKALGRRLGARRPAPPRRTGDADPGPSCRWPQPGSAHCRALFAVKTLPACDGHASRRSHGRGVGGKAEVVTGGFLAPDFFLQSSNPNSEYSGLIGSSSAEIARFFDAICRGTRSSYDQTLSLFNVSTKFFHSKTKWSSSEREACS